MISIWYHPAFETHTLERLQNKQKFEHKNEKNYPYSNAVYNQYCQSIQNISLRHKIKKKKFSAVKEIVNLLRSWRTDKHAID